jgi:NADPH:quinone reductase-like Zn-dependent oxidoreductase
VVHALGATPVVEDRPAPEPGPGQALVQLGAAALNPVDLAIAGGTFYGGHPPLPFAAGREGVGRVIAGTRFAPGTRIATLKAATGSLAEQFVVDEADAWEIPEGDDAVAAALGIAGLAGWMAVEERGGLAPGERVLVLGATGFVGSVAVQAARLLGAERIVAAGRDPERLERCRELGADATVVLGEPDGMADALRAAFPDGGPQLVVDPLWGAPAAAAMAIAPVDMRLVQLGQSAGAEIALASATVRGRRLRIVGHTVFEAPVEALAEAHRRMLDHAALGELRARLDAMPLARAAEAWDRQRAGTRVKLVVTRG